MGRGVCSAWRGARGSLELWLEVVAGDLAVEKAAEVELDVEAVADRAELLGDAAVLDDDAALAVGGVGLREPPELHAAADDRPDRHELADGERQVVKKIVRDRRRRGRREEVVRAQVERDAYDEQRFRARKVRFDGRQTSPWQGSVFLRFT